MKACIVQLQCITNMHVGNGDVNYNIIDNEVERDPITNYPMINASGVKGALREFYENYENSAQTDADTTKKIFGASSKSESSQGQVKILGAEMVAIPARASDGDNPFYLVSTEAALERINELTQLFIGRKWIPEFQELKNCKIGVEGYIPGKKAVCTFREKEKEVTKNIYLMKNNEFDMIALPVVARNKLDNGLSKNLWYEEIVPHDSIFVFPVISEDEALLDNFVDFIEGKVIQFGGNASIGYGLCKVTVIKG